MDDYEAFDGDLGDDKLIADTLMRVSTSRSTLCGISDATTNRCYAAVWSRIEIQWN